MRRDTGKIQEVKTLVLIYTHTRARLLASFYITLARQAETKGFC